MALPDWVAIAGVATGVGATLLSLFKVRPEARKLNADGAAAITTSAGAFVTAVNAEMQELREEVADLRRWRNRTDQRMRVHARWDDNVAAAARAAGLDVGDPPKLYDDQD